MDTRPENHPTRRPRSANTRRYDRIARFYSTFEPFYLIFPPARRRAVAALGPKAGDTVLEIGAGTGRNFPFLVEAVGPSGTIIGVDASPGMLAEAHKLVEQRGCSNVQLLRQDATQLQIDGDVDGALFSLSYSAMPDPRPALARAWERLRPSSRVVVMDIGLTQREHRDLRSSRLIDKDLDRVEKLIDLA
jgi:ubiquinone/menaquinone biosynthesis C-methylase UbiE